jgi:Baseplate J-like protein
MVDFVDAANEQQFIESTREIFRAYLPESDAWAYPNMFSIYATVIGGLAWSSVNEARRGFDARINPQTATGDNLDLIAAQPPLNLLRNGATLSTGMLSVTGWTLATVPVGYQFQTASGKQYVTTSGAVLTAGAGLLSVKSVITGAAQNSPMGQQLTAAGGTAKSLGIFGGFDIETDDQLRARIYAARREFNFFGSSCSYIDALKGFPGVTRAWPVEDGLMSYIVIEMADAYPCGSPLPADITAIENYFTTACLTPLCAPPCFKPVKGLTIHPEITYKDCAADICEINAAMQAWLRANYDLGEGVQACDIRAWLQENYGELGPVISCCEDYPPVCNAVYNCVELIGG